MEQVIALILAPILVVLIGLIVEYWVIQPIRQKQTESATQKKHIIDISNEQSISAQVKVSNESNSSSLKMTVLSDTVEPSPFSQPIWTQSLQRGHTSVSLKLLHIFDKKPLTDVNFTPDGRFISYFASRKGKIYVTWLSVEKNHRPQSLGIIYDDTEIPASYKNTKIPVFNYNNAETLFYSPNNRFCAITEYGKVDIWDIEAKKLHKQLDTENKELVAISNDGKFIASARNRVVNKERHTKRCDIEIWRLQDEGLIYHNTFSISIHHLKIRPTDNRLLLILDSLILVLEINDDHVNEVHRFEIKGIGSDINLSFDLSIFSFYFDSRFYIFNLKDEKHFSFPSAVSVSTFSYSPDLKTIVSGDNDYALRVWDIESGQLLRTLRGHSSYIRDIQVSTDGQLIASHSGNSVIRFWRFSDGYPIAALKNFNGTIKFNLDAVTFLQYNHFPEPKRQAKPSLSKLIGKTPKFLENPVDVWRIEFLTKP